MSVSRDGAPQSWIIRQADVGHGQPVDVRIVGPRIVAVAPQLRPTGDDEVIDARGGALLPGLHDHHIHLHAFAAALHSVPCGPPAVRDRPGLTTALRGVAGDGWVRGIGYHESVAGPLDRWVLDTIEPRRPVRVQHRSGALWMLNSAAVDQVGLESAHLSGVERRDDGVVTGRLWRLDRWLGDRPGGDPIDLAPVGRRLASFGITGVSDATPAMSERAVASLVDAVDQGQLGLDIQLLGAPSDAHLGDRLHLGPHKILLSDHELPAYETLLEDIRGARREQRAVALHCVTRESLILALTALDELGSVSSDRIEHAAVVPVELIPTIKRLGLRVVTQPALVAERGDYYVAEVSPDDRDDLYRFASLLAAGVPTVASSDAPFGPCDPWSVMAAARDRRSPAGRVIGEDERVDPAPALAGFLSPLDDPGGAPRAVAPGAAADLCLLHAPLAEAMTSPTAELVRLTVKGGVVLDF